MYNYISIFISASLGPFSQVLSHMYILLHVVILCFLQVFRSSNYAYNIIGKMGRRFQLCHQFLAEFLLS